MGVISKDLFIGLGDGLAHLCTGGEAPMLCGAERQLARFVQLKGRGMAGREEILSVYAETKELLAKYLGTPGGTDDLAFLNHAADGFNVLARGLEWRPGDEIVSLKNEYPSSLLPGLARCQLGVRLTAVDPGGDPEGAIEAAVTERTRVISVSHVSYLTGVRLDLARLRRIADSCGAILAVDASHSLGVVPVPIEHCDVVVSCCYKFLLAVHGVGVFYWDRERLPELTQFSVGWSSIEWPDVDERWRGYRLKPGASRFELGNPSYISLFVLNVALRLLLTADPVEMESQVLKLGEILEDGLRAMDIPLWTPEEPKRRGPNVAFPSKRSEELVSKLAERKVLAWSGDDRVRFSIHGFNAEEDIQAALEALSTLL
jgi:selenocysteine lyase/cysteine desulfurase